MNSDQLIFIILVGLIGFWIGWHEAKSHRITKQKAKEVNKTT